MKERSYLVIEAKEVRTLKEVIRSDGWRRFACGDVLCRYDIDQLFGGSFLPIAHQTFWSLGPRVVHLSLCRALLLCSLCLVCSSSLSSANISLSCLQSMLNHLRRSRRLEKVRPGTWTGSEEGVEGKRSRMWTHEDGKRWTHEDGKIL